MMGFIEWVEFNKKKKQKEEKDVRSISQSSQENGNVDHKRQATGIYPKIYTTVVHDFTRSDWKDYRGGD
jgi:hypothetical protein